MKKYNIECKMEQAEFEKIYGLLSASLPAEEIRSFELQFKLFSKKPYHLYVKKTEQGEIIGILSAWEFEDLRFIEHLAVNESFRGGGIGGKILEEYLKMDDRQVILEVELPDNDMAKRRIGFYERHGFGLNTFQYEQLPLNKGDQPLPLYLMTYPVTLSEEEFEKKKEFLYDSVYRISVPQ